MTSVEVGEVGRAEPAVVRPESHLHFRIALASLWKGGCGEVLGDSWRDGGAMVKSTILTYRRVDFKEIKRHIMHFFQFEFSEF